MALRRVLNRAKPWSVKGAVSRFDGTNFNPTSGRRYYRLPPPPTLLERIDRQSSLAKESPRCSKSLRLGFPSDLNILLRPRVQDDLVRHVPCDGGDRGAIHAAEYAVEVLNAELYQGGVCLTRVVSADVIHRGWSIYSVSFEGRDRKGDLGLYHAYVLRDPATKIYMLFKGGAEDDSFPKPSQPGRHSDPVEISHGAIDSFSPWESKKIVMQPEAFVPIDIDEYEETKSMLTKHARTLLESLSSVEDYSISFDDLKCASKAENYGGMVLHFLVLQATINDYFRCFVAIIESEKLLLLRPVDTLF